MTRENDQTRREFLTASVKTASAGAIISQLPVSRFVHAAGSGTIRLGLIGCGGRGVGAVANVLNVCAEAQLAAVGDAFEDRALDGVERLQKKNRTRGAVSRERIFVGFDAYSQVIQSGVDLVLLATPPGFRPMHFEAAVRAGKHVFMEKPLAVDSPGIRKVLATAELANQKSLKVGVGFQRRHEENYMETVRRIREGAVGTIRTMEAFWNGAGIWSRARRPEQTEMEYQMTNWYHFVWLCGEQIVEQLTNNLDVCQWIKGVPPARARGTGGRKERRGSDWGESFDHFQVEYTYEDGSHLLSECCHLKSAEHRVGEIVTGTTGSADLLAGKIQGATNWEYRGEPPNAFDAEQAALIGAIRRDTPYNEAPDAAMSTMMGIMGRIAAYDAREITWDEAINSNEAYLPERYAWDADPPSLPDKFGDYIVPARGKRLPR